MDITPTRYIPPSDPALRRHVLSEIWGDLPQEERDKLRLDIRDRGVQDAITVFQGQVLDGWHRYQAWQQSGQTMPIPSVEFDGSDEAARLLVIAKNALRRHLKAAERARCVLQVTEWAGSGRPKKKEPEKPASVLPKTHKELAQQANVSVPTIRREKKKLQEEEAALQEASGALPPSPPPPPAPPKRTAAERLAVTEQEKTALGIELEEQRRLTEDAESRAEVAAKALSGDSQASIKRISNLEAALKAAKSSIGQWQAKHREELARRKACEKKCAALQAENDALRKRMADLEAEEPF